MTVTRRVGQARRAATVLALGAALLLTSSCGPSDNGAPVTARREIAPQWQDVFDGTPEMYVVVRPQAIKRDAVYGAFFKNLLRVAQARTAMRGVTTLEALEGSEEIVIGIRKDQQGEDAAMVIRGVPASLDVQKMMGTGGAPAMRLVDSKSKVPEYQFTDRQSAEAGSVFVLPDRTWVGTLGEARVRARQAFASPFGRPAPKADPEALAMVRFDAAAFFQQPRYEKSPIMGPLVRKLRALSLALKPGKGGVLATLQYENEDAAAFAEMHVKRVLEEVSKQEPRAGRPSLEWLRTAQVGHDGASVTVRLAVPTRLLEELPNATGNDLPL